MSSTRRLVRTVGWILVAAGVVLIVRSVAFDKHWLQVTEAVGGGALIVVGLAVVLLSRRTR